MMGDQQQVVQGVVRSFGAGQALVEVNHVGCGRCEEPGGCGGVNIAQMSCSGRKRYRVIDPLGVTSGQKVLIGIPLTMLNRTATQVYLFPLLAALIGAGVGALFSSDENQLPSIMGLFVGLAIAWLFLRKSQVAGGTLPIILQIQSDEGAT